ncbi:MAG: hypothetical protein EXS15_00660 [Phycisphaerales bacterium]|nr:hypothetical protein [Phycisphaerales bacterium]
MSSPNARGPIRPLIILLLLFVVLVWPVILFGGDHTSESDDQNRHHLVVIREAVQSITGADGAPSIGVFLCDYPSATSPGYHMALALFDAVGMGHVTLLRVMSSLCGFALVVVLWKILCRALDAWTALACTAPLLCSPYFLSGSMWLTTDVASLLFVVVVIGSLLHWHATPNHSARRSVQRGLFASLAVLVRQSSIWIVGPMLLWGWWINSTEELWRNRWPLKRARSAPFVGWVIGLALPVATLGLLVTMWGGLMPPAYRSLHNAGLNLATPAFALSLVALWGLPFAAALHDFKAAPSALSIRSITIAAGIGLMLAIVPHTSYDQAAGRWGGPLWSVVQATPSIAGRSLVLLALAPLGGAVVAALLRGATERGNARCGWMLVASLVCMVSALSVNTQCWERYVDLPLLALLPLFVMIALDPSASWQRKRLARACVLLVIIQFGLSLWMVYRPTFLESAV